MTKLDGFDERLLGELKQVVARRTATPTAVPAPRARLGWKPKVALVAGAVTLGAVGAVAATLVPGQQTTPAYAVSPQRDGSVRVEIRQLSDADGLERKLADAGVAAEVDYLPVGKRCQQPRFTESEDRSQIAVEVYDTGIAFTVEPAELVDRTLVIETSGETSGLASVAIAVAEGDVAPCEPVAGAGPVASEPVPPKGGTTGATAGGQPR